VTFYGPLKTAFHRESDLFIKTKGLEKILPYDLAGIFNKAYSRVAAIAKGISGLKATGIYPLSPSVFSEEDFVAVNTLKSDNGEILSSALGPDITESSYSPEQEDSTNSQNSNLLISCQPSCSKDIDPYCPATVSSLPVSIEAVSPLPVVSPQTPCRQSRSKQHSKIMTGTPMKVSLESKAIKRNARAQKKSRPPAISSKKRQNKESLKQRKKRCRKNLKKQLDLSSSEENTDINDQNICDDNEEDDVETYCEKRFICEEFGTDGELWYRCTGCGIWAQADCSRCEFPDGYLCDVCLRRRNTKLKHTQGI
jgi:hypothetical protein